MATLHSPTRKPVPSTHLPPLEKIPPVSPSPDDLAPPPAPVAGVDTKLKSPEKKTGDKKKRLSAHDRLPRELLENILYRADPSTFDCLALTSSAWNKASRSVHLYLHQLSQCGVTAPDTEPLPELMRRFAAIARRELFDSVLRPTVSEIQLVYTAAASATALPGGESFRYQFSSPQGTQLLALASDRIFVIDLSGAEMRVRRELKLSKRPVSAAILDDGSVLAVLNMNFRVSLYDLRGSVARFMRSLPLDNEPRTIALSPGAEVLGAAFEGGIEVYSLHEDAAPTDRRSVNCDTVDALSFSPDGTILLGTTVNSASPTTVLVTAQHFSTDMPVEGLAQLWTTQVLFPRSSRDSSHATFLPANEDEEEVAWTFTYDRVYQTFRAVRVEDLRNGHTYFNGPSASDGSPIPPSALPTSTRDGSLVAAGFNNSLWLYGPPRDLEPPLLPSTDASPTTTPERSSSNASANRLWQIRLSDKFRNVFLSGRHIHSLPGLTSLRFTTGTRLIAVSTTPTPTTATPINDYTDFSASPATPVGAITLLTFHRHPTTTATTRTLELGDGAHGTLETLREHPPSLEVEVDLARRRTIRSHPRLLPAATPPTTPRPSPARFNTVIGPDGLPVPNTPAAPPARDDAWVPPPPPYVEREAAPVPLPPALLQTLQPPVQERRQTLANVRRRLTMGRRASVAARGLQSQSVGSLHGGLARSGSQRSVRSVQERRSRAAVSAVRNVEDARRRWGAGGEEARRGRGCVVM